MEGWAIGCWRVSVTTIKNQKCEVATINTLGPPSIDALVRHAALRRGVGDRGSLSMGKPRAHTRITTLDNNQHPAS